MAHRYPRRKLSLADIKKAVNVDSDTDDSTDKIDLFI